MPTATELVEPLALMFEDDGSIPNNPRLPLLVYRNAIDISGFTLADGRVVTVKGGWAGGPAERGFLRAVRLGACDLFTTVLGPGYDANHHDHLHLDLARHGGSGRVCK